MVELPVAQLMPEYGQYLLPVAACLLLLLLFLLLFLLLCFLLLLLYQILFRLQLLPFLLLQQGVKQDNTFELCKYQAHLYFAIYVFVTVKCNKKMFF